MRFSVTSTRCVRSLIPAQYMRVDRLFEFACCLIRAGGVEDQGWDPIVESTALKDLDKLSTEPLDPDKFKHPERTRARLALLSYCHLTEAKLFYHVLANLARLGQVTSTT